MKRFHRGDKSSDHPGRVFLNYDLGKEIWVTPARLERVTLQVRKCGAKWRAKKREEWDAIKDSHPRKYHCGDTSPDKPGLIFWHLCHHGRERWVTPEKFTQLRDYKKRTGKKYPKSKASREKDKIRQKERQKTSEFKERSAKWQREHRHVYSPRYRNKRRAYKKMRRATDPAFRLKENIGANIRIAMKRKNVRKSQHINELLGCTYDFFRGWLENQFTDKMCWENYGEWHVDHVVAINLFPIENKEARGMAFNYRNCRPLWGPENLSKNDKLDFDLVEKYGLQEWLNYIKPEFLKNNVIPFPIQQTA